MKTTKNEGFLCRLRMAVNGLLFLGAIGLSASTRAQPTLVSALPANGTAGVSSNAPIVFTFSAAMDTSLTSVEFINPATPMAPSATTSSWSSDHTRLTCTPVTPWPANGMIYWVVKGQDTAGNSLTGEPNGLFSTLAPPTLVSITPANGTAGVSPTAAVSFIFSGIMDTNKTVATFALASAPSSPLPVTSVWTGMTMLACTPTPAFPAGQQINWTVTGADLYGNALQGGSGSFTTAHGGGQTGGACTAIVSRGELIEQSDANAFQSASEEFVALASTAFTNTLAVIAPVPGGTNILGNNGWTDAIEFENAFDTSEEFATNYPSGTYTLTIPSENSPTSAAMPLTDGTLPSAPRILNWGVTKPYALLGRDYQFQWSLPAGGASADYFRLRVEQDGSVIFATPLPGAPGALTGLSNAVVLPASFLTNAGRVDVRLTAFSFTGMDTNSIPGATLHSARHRTTMFDFYLVDGSIPPPVILTTNVTGIGVGQPYLTMLQTANGVSPLTFQVLSGALPPGFSLNSAGALWGQAVSLGTWTAEVQVFDLLGRNWTQSIGMTTVAPDGPNEPPCLANLEAGPGRAFACDLLCATGITYVVETSSDLRNWSTVQTYDALTNRIHMVLPAGSGSAFFRARGPGWSALPAPHPLSVTPVLNTNAAASSWFSTYGGVLVLTNRQGYVFTLTLPPWALPASQTITMTELSQVGGLPFDNGLLAAVDLQPDGLQFNLPVRLDIVAPAGVSTNGLLGFGAHGDGTEFALAPTFVTNQTATLWLGHFSMAGAGSGTAANAQAQAQNTPTDPFAAMAQIIAQTKAACIAEANCTLDDQLLSIGQLELQAFAQVVRPKLIAAEGDDSALDDAGASFLSWAKDVSLLHGSGEPDTKTKLGQVEAALQRCIAEGMSRLGTALQNALQKSCQRCLDHDLQQISRMFQVAKWAALLNEGLDAQLWSCVDRCLRFRLDLDSEIVIPADDPISVTTKARVKLRFANGDFGSSLNQQGTAFLTGSAAWQITDTQFADVSPCVVVEKWQSGRRSVPYAALTLFQKQGTNFVYAPDLVMAMQSGLGPMPLEDRILYCPETPPQPIANLYGEIFNGTHTQAGELAVPPGDPLAEMCGCPIFVIKGFFGPGSGDVLLERPYNLWMGEAFEVDTFTLHHTPSHLIITRSAQG